MSTGLHLWGRLSSINVRKVVWLMQELGLPFERTDAGAAFGVTHTPEYLRKNPNALVPLLEDGDYVLWESNVILRYLCAKYSAGDLYPTNLQQRFDQERWMDWQQTSFNPAGRDAFVQTVRTAPEQRQPERVRQSVAATQDLLALLESHLAQQPYVSGARWGMADIALGCEMHRWWNLPEPVLAQCQALRKPLSDYPRIQAWYAALRLRPAARGVLDLPLS